jgi:protein-tyrosine phosphatase
MKLKHYKAMNNLDHLTFSLNTQTDHQHEKPMNIKTSITHPLRIDSIKIPEAGGEIGMTLCPGKHQNYARSGQWARDLALDIQAIEDWDAKIVITLMEQHELDRFSVSHLPDEVEKAGIRWLHLLIVDRNIPDNDFESAWEIHGPELIATVNSGSKIVLHCLGGLGRTGTIASRMLVEMGMTADEAITTVRTARRHTIETEHQEQYVRQLEHR